MLTYDPTTGLFVRRNPASGQIKALHVQVGAVPPSSYLIVHNAVCAKSTSPPTKAPRPQTKHQSKSSHSLLAPALSFTPLTVFWPLDYARMVPQIVHEALGPSARGWRLESHQRARQAQPQERL